MGEFRRERKQQDFVQNHWYKGDVTLQACFCRVTNSTLSTEWWRKVEKFKALKIRLSKFSGNSGFRVLNQYGSKWVFSHSKSPVERVLGL